jgi:cardiolipin synthase
MIHNKVLVVDGIFATIGSINLDARSMSINAEDGVSFYDRNVAGQMEAMFQADRQRCEEVSYAQWKKRGFAKRSTEFLSWIWEPYY